MGFKIVFTKPAITDLSGLVRFVARNDPKAAESLGFAIIAKTQTLNEFPRLGRVVPEFKIEKIREIIHRPYRIVYRVNDVQNAVEILRVWHAARGTPIILK